MDAKLYLHSVNVGGSGGVTLDTPFVAVSIWDGTQLMPASCLFDSLDPYAICADGVAGLKYHPQLSRSGAVLDNPDNKFVYVLSVATHSATPPVVSFFYPPDGFSTLYTPFAIQGQQPAYWLSNPVFRRNGQGTYVELWHNSPVGVAPATIQIGWTWQQALDAGWYSRV